MTDPRRVLGVGPHATAEQVRSAYRRLAKMHHPDAGGQSERFKEIYEAYIRLCTSTTYPVRCADNVHQVKVVYGRRNTYNPSLLWIRKILLHKLVWQTARARMTFPVVAVLAAPVLLWPLNPYAAAVVGIFTLVGCKTTHRKF